MIKVDFVSKKARETGPTTHPVVVEGLIRAISKVNEDIVVAEGDANMTSADKAVTETGIVDLCERYGIRFVNLKKQKEKLVVRPGRPRCYRALSFLKLLLIASWMRLR